MKEIRGKIYIIFLILFLASCTPPPLPKPKPVNDVTIDSPNIIKKENNQHLSLKRLQSTLPELKGQNYSLIIKFFENYIIEEHEMTFVSNNLQDGELLNGSLSLRNSSDSFYDEFYYTCEIFSKDGFLLFYNCDANLTLMDDNHSFQIDYFFQFYNSQILKITISYKKMDYIKEKLYNFYKLKYFLIQSEYTFSLCNYEYILPEGYKNLSGLNNIWRTKSDNIYFYTGVCLNQSNEESIIFTPTKTFWSAMIELFLIYNYTDTFTNDVTFIFPRYFRGGRLNNAFYTISSYLNNVYNEENSINYDLKLEVTVPAQNQQRVSVKVETGFINDLNEDFKVYFPESYYKIDNANIPQEIINKAEEIINNNIGIPYYISLGKFVHSYITKNSNYSGVRYSPLEIFNNKVGTFEEITILYNTMLNSVGIKTLYLTGWFIKENDTSGIEENTNYAWTAALIGETWIELDANEGLFEGVSAGHILKNFFYDDYSFSINEAMEPDKGQNVGVNMCNNIDDIFQNPIGKISFTSNVVSTILKLRKLSSTTYLPTEEYTDELGEEEYNKTSEKENIKPSETTINITNITYGAKNNSEPTEVSAKPSETTINTITYEEKYNSESEVISTKPSETTINITYEAKKNNSEPTEVSAKPSEKIINITYEEKKNSEYEEESTKPSETTINTIAYEAKNNSEPTEVSTKPSEKIINITYEAKNKIIQNPQK